MVERVEGIILNTMDFKDQHKILYLLTNEKKTSLLVQRAKRFKEGLMNETQRLTRVSFSYKEGNLDKATMIEALDYYSEIKENIKKMAVAEYVLEVIYRDIHDDFNTDLLYKLVVSFLEELKVRDDIKVLLLEFRIKMLYFLGIQPNFKMCAHCGTTNDLVGLSLKLGSMECINHTSKDNIGIYSTNIIKLLYQDKTLKITIEDEDVINYISNQIDEYYSYHLTGEIKSISMLRKLGLY